MVVEVNGIFSVNNIYSYQHERAAAEYMQKPKRLIDMPPSKIL